MTPAVTQAAYPTPAPPMNAVEQADYAFMSDVIDAARKLRAKGLPPREHLMSAALDLAYGCRDRDECLRLAALALLLAGQDAVAPSTAWHDDLTAFLAECCIQGEGASVSCGDLYVAYQMHCAHAGVIALSQHGLSLALLDRGVERVAGAIRRWRGLALKEAQP